MARKPSLLIVEDDPLLLRMYQDKFLKEGHKIRVATNGEDALEKIKDERPDVVVLDIMMPKMDGFQMLSTIKADPDLKNIPVIMLTNLSGEDAAMKGLEMGAVAYIIKGLDPPEVVYKRIKEILAGYTRDEGIPTVER